MVWRKMGKKIKRAVRCTTGRRKGRVVSNPTINCIHQHEKTYDPPKEQKQKWVNVLVEKQIEQKGLIMSRRPRQLNRSTSKRR